MRALTRVATFAAMVIIGASLPTAQTPATKTTDLVAPARAALAQLDGTIMIYGLREPVEVLRDRWGIPHIYAKNTHDLFFAQGYVAAQDRMWQLEMWRRNGEGRLAEVLGEAYVTRDTFARLLTFRGNWDEEFRKYHPEGPVIFDAFARGVNASIQKALDENRIPVEFTIMGFRPQPVWTARTMLTRMPGWTLTRNVASEVQRALDVKAMGIDKVLELKPTDPEKRFTIPQGLNLDDIEPGILNVTREASNLRWNLAPAATARPGGSAAAGNGAAGGSVEAVAAANDGGGRVANPLIEQLVRSVGITANPWLPEPDLGSNNWVIGGSKSVTGKPIIANDPHREVVNPSLRYVVHLEAPGLSVIGATEPGHPGIAIGHNDRLAWGFTILGTDQQDLYVEETDPQHPTRYLVNGEWTEMDVEKQLIWIKGKTEPLVIENAFTRHGPVLFQNAKKTRAFALRWVGADPGGAGYLGSLNVMQARNWKEFNDALAKSWYTPSHSLVYADVDGNYGYVGVAQTPIRKNWDGLLPVPGKDSQYEWAGYVPFEQLPKHLNSPKGFYNSSNNDVVPKIVPTYTIPLGYEYSAPYRYDRVAEVLSQKKTFTVADMAALQQDVVSLPARALVPLLKPLKIQDARVAKARDMLTGWNYVLDKESVPATIYEYFALKLGPLAYAPRTPEAARARVTSYDMRRIIAWMRKPDRAYGARPVQGRDAILVDALTQAVDGLTKKLGDDMATWKWGDLHTADFVHPLAGAPGGSDLFRIDPVRRGGDGFTVMAATSPSETSSKQTSGASFSFVFDVQDWDRSVGLNVPGNSAQPLSPHYKDLTKAWGEGPPFPMAYSRKKVEEVTAHRLILQPIRDGATAGRVAGNPVRSDGTLDLEQLFEPVQPQMFEVQGGQPNAWADFDGDGDLDMYIGFRGQMSRLYRNDNGTFVNVAAQVGLADSDEVRVAAWGDYDDDGDPDLFVGYARTSGVPNRMYRNDGGKTFVDVGRSLGVDLYGTTRQASFIDYDNDGDTDFFVAFRDRPNALFRNDGGKYTEVGAQAGIADPRKTVGVAWFDMDSDGDLDAFVANQDGDLNGFFRNDGATFTDVAKPMGMDGAGRPLVYGGVGPGVADYDNDGDLDLFVANYGPNALYRNDGGGTFTDVAPETSVAGDYHATTTAWGDFDNDGHVDLYVAAFLGNMMYARDYLYKNDGATFRDVLPSVIAKRDATHGVQWVDYDADGDLDLALADNGTMGAHMIFRSRLPTGMRQRGLNVLVVDGRGRYTRAGSEVRVYKAGTRTLVGMSMVDTGSGYCSQNMMPVHVGLPAADPVDVEVTTFTTSGKKVTKTPGVDPKALGGKALVVKAG